MYVFSDKVFVLHVSVFKYATQAINLKGKEYSIHVIHVFLLSFLKNNIYVFNEYSQTTFF